MAATPSVFHVEATNASHVPESLPEETATRFEPLDGVSSDAYLGLTHALAAAGLSPERLDRGVMLIGDLAPFRRLAERVLHLRFAAANGGIDGADREDPVASALTILLVGGSTAAGAELTDPSQNFAAMFADWLSNSLSVNVTVLNMAVGATASDYYALCAGEHLRDGVDIVLAEHAVNDLVVEAHGFTSHESSLVEQELRQVRAHAPGAAFFYAGTIPWFQKCVSGEDLPGLASTLAHWRAGYVSLRNMLVGVPGSSDWPTGILEAGINANRDSCNINLEPPLDWYAMFPTAPGPGHPRGQANVLLSLLLARAVTSAFAKLSMLGWKVIDGGGQASLEPEPLHNETHEAPCLGGPPFNCRTTLSPSFGVALTPLAAACKVAWSGTTPQFNGPSCPDEATAWGDSHSASLPSEIANLTTLPVVDGWERREIANIRGEEPGSNGRGPARIRQDRKFFWGSLPTYEPKSIRFPVTVGSRGAVYVVYFTDQGGSAEFTVLCGEASVCNGTMPLVLVSGGGGNGGQRHTFAEQVASKLPPGRYILLVKSLGAFALVAVASG